MGERLAFYFSIRGGLAQWLLTKREREREREREETRKEITKTTNYRKTETTKEIHRKKEPPTDRKKEKHSTSHNSLLARCKTEPCKLIAILHSLMQNEVV